MKTILKTILAITTISILTGCAGSQPIAPTIAKQNDGTVLIKTKAEKNKNDNLSIKEKILFEYTNDLKLTLNKASEYAINNGFSHFVIVSNNTNNFNGFPLNTFKDMNEYCNASYLTNEDIKSKCGNFMAYGSSYNEMKIIALNNPDYTISAFDAKTTLQETK